MAVVVLRPLYRVSPRGEEGISWLDEPTSPTASVFFFIAPFCLINRKFDGIEDEIVHKPFSATSSVVEAEREAFISFIPLFPDNAPEKEKILPECEKSVENEYFWISNRSVVFVFAQKDVEPIEKEDEMDVSSKLEERVFETGPSLKEADTLA